MAEVEVAAMLAQFGAAGLVGWMWLSERRAAAARERALDEAHGRIMGQRQELQVVLRALEDNTRALSGLESGQQRLLAVLDAILRERRGEKRNRSKPPRAVASGAPDHGKAGANARGRGAG